MPVIDARTCQIFYKSTIALSGKKVRRDFTHAPSHQEFCPDHFTIQQGGSRSYPEQLFSPRRTILQNVNRRLPVYLELGKKF